MFLTKFLKNLFRKTEPRFMVHGRDRFGCIVHADSHNCIHGPYGVFDIAQTRTVGPLFMEQIHATRHAERLNTQTNKG